MARRGVNRDCKAAGSPLAAIWPATLKGMILPACGNAAEHTVYLATHDGLRQGPIGIEPRALPPESARHRQQRVLGTSVRAGCVAKPVSGGRNGIHGGGVVNPAGISE